MTELYFGLSDSFAVASFNDRSAVDEITMIMSAFDCVLPDDSGVYCSSDITTGKSYYFDLLIKHGVSSDAELREKLGDSPYDDAILWLANKNVKRGIEFTESLRKQGLSNLVNPGPFFAPGFDQQHYLYLWEWVIMKKICEARFNDDWEYSNGCTLEYAVALKKGIQRLDRNGSLLSADGAASRIRSAIADLSARGFSVEKLRTNLALIDALR